MANPVLVRLWNVECIRQLILYSDVSVVTDPFTRFYIGREKKPNTDALLFLLTRVAVARVLEPLLRAGVIRFRSNTLPLCAQHLSEMEGKVDDAVGSYLEKYRDKVEILDISKKEVGVDFGEMHEPHLILHSKLGRTAQRRYSDPNRRAALIEEIVYSIIAHEANEAIIGATKAAEMQAVILSNSRASLSALLTIENRLPPRMEFDYWENQRSAELPWINSLTPSEILQLRSDADTALPRLRARLARVLRVRNLDDVDDDTDEWGALVDELREETEEVKAELDAIPLRKERHYRNVVGAAGLGIALYGFAADLPALSLASLLSVLGLVHTVGGREEQERSKLASRPGYVFVKAREILAHRH